MGDDIASNGAPTGNDGWKHAQSDASLGCGLQIITPKQVTAGRANFITGELPIRTGMTTVGRLHEPCPGCNNRHSTWLGYATGQFAHPGD
jgi:hypothetical protein